MSILKISFFALLLVNLYSCSKPDGKATVGITVVNEKGVPIQNCNIKLSTPVSPETQWGVDYFYAQTDEDGYVEFTMKVNAYFDVYVWKGYWEGCDFVEFEPNEFNKKSVVIYPAGTVFNGCIK